MGSSQSASVKSSAVDKNMNINPTISNINNDRNASDGNGDLLNEKKDTKKKTIPQNLSGFALVEYKCRKKRARYDRCYRQKHSAFIVGSKLIDKDGDVDETPCDDLFEAYKDCMYKGMLRDRKQRGLSKAGSESALGDYYDDDEE